ncbi:MAG: chloramphenicol acetyltransferase [Daejeonella sp.]
MVTKLDLENWPRKDHFNFFRKFEEPFFGLTVQIDCSAGYKKCSNDDQSFFLFYLHKALVAVNKVEPFRYRIDANQVIIHDEIMASATINRPDGTFGFSYIPYYEDFEEFKINAKLEIERVKSTVGLDPAGAGQNVIHFSSIPWLNFTSLSHARNYSFEDSCPKISVGKMTSENGILQMPVSIHVNHALMDGIHVAQFVSLFQQLMNS